MTAPADARVRAFTTAEIVLPGDPLDDTVAFFVDALGFRIAEVVPADDPELVVLAGPGLRIRLERGRSADPGTVMLRGDRAGEPVVAPNGTRIVWALAEPPVDVPPLRPRLAVSRLADARWIDGRAGMQYRDLLDDRQGGRFIASHIRIPDGGPVPDYVHYHRTRFQLIYCYRGWVRVAYEDQGAAITMRPGDCVVQPPEIRHRVLACSAGLEVIELGSPARHDTYADLELTLPTAVVRTDRAWAGQRFVHHVGEDGGPTGVAGATAGLVGVARLELSPQTAPPVVHHEGELRFVFVLDGEAALDCEGQGRHALSAGDAVAIPPHRRHSLSTPSSAALLEVLAPAEVKRVHHPDAERPS